MEESNQKMRVNILALQEEKMQLTGTFGEKHHQDTQKLQQLLKKQVWAAWRGGAWRGGAWCGALASHACH